MDGQSEWVNQVLEQYLRCTINYHQDNWAELLPFAEFVYNNSTHSSIQIALFLANYEFHPRFDIQGPVPASVPSAETMVARLQNIQERLVIELGAAQERYKKYADRCQQEVPLYKFGDKVWLLKQHIRTERPSEKLDYRKLEPFEIAEQISQIAFRLTLPSSFKIHNTFHVSLLEPYTANTFSGRVAEPPPPVTIDEESEYEVKEILMQSWFGISYFTWWTGKVMMQMNVCGSLGKT
ncbi:17006_t:CDS:1 [Dentiscutata erythropus]|uniref:17006_t:CDS:1 n=1 Tax=Dentiscutata erythropus TaxID=1348616 RepID=A0A9N9N8D0_9GLOM|nr:17006_t:CDS:1 [Dentiscutata erythropus]